MTEVRQRTAPAWLTRLFPASRARGPIVLGVLALSAVALGWAIHSGRLTTIAGFDRAAALTATDRAADFLRVVRTLREKRPALDSRLTAVADASLGDRLDVVDGALRARLNRIGEETGIRDLMVATGVATERRNPNRAEMTRMTLPRPLREEADFVEVRATISGEGAVDQVLRLVHRIAIDPMVKRIEMVRFDPQKDGGRVRATMKLATIFMPGRAPASMPGAPSADAIAGFSKYAVLAQRNPFRVPEAITPTAPTSPVVAVASAPGAPAVAAVAAPDVPAGFPYGQWLLTGIIDGPVGTEAWFRNAATKEERVLRINETIAEFALVGLAPDGARIAAGGATYVLRVGDSLEARAVEAASK